jgi:GNAT superfamily N-acetyltransferase
MKFAHNSSNMNVQIREATRDDFPAILEMIRELALYEKAPEKVTNTVAQMEAEQSLFRSFVAVDERGETIGMAVCFFAYYTWVGKSLYLDDIYVKEPYRGLKVGGALLKRVFELANAEGCKRLRWQVLNWNEPAIAVYQRYGSEIDDEWLNCSFDEEGIAGLLDE